MTKPHHDRLTLEQLRATTCYADLTPKQQKLVDAFVNSGGDRTAAVLAAYNVKNKQNARILAYQVFARPAVVACLTAYFQDDPLASFKAEVRAAYRKKDITVSQVRAMVLHADLNGWGSAALPKEALHGRDADPSTEPVPPIENGTAPVFFVGQRVTERGPDGVLHTGVVKALDASGRPSDIEEVKS